MEWILFGAWENTPQLKISVLCFRNIVILSINLQITQDAVCMIYSKMVPQSYLCCLKKHLTSSDYSSLVGGVEHFLWISILLGISSSVTKSMIFSEGQVYHQPVLSILIPTVAKWLVQNYSYSYNYSYIPLYHQPVLITIHQAVSC